MRPAGGTAYWLLSDHLGSTALRVNSSGDRQAEQRYYPFGLDRYKYGTLYTDYRFTGQRVEDNTDLYFYQSRWYDPVVGRFLQPDTIVPEPGNPQSLNRYSYTLNNPVKYTDPSGHAYEQGTGGGGAIDYNVEDSAMQLYWLMISHWFLEQGRDPIELGILWDATQDVRAAVEADGLLEDWAAMGYPVPFHWAPPTVDTRMDIHDASTWDPTLLFEGFNTLWQSHFVKGPNALRGIGDATAEGDNDALSGTLGSIDEVTIEYDDKSYSLKVSASNETSYQSGSRLPGLPFGLLQNKKRGVPFWQPVPIIGPGYIWPFGGTSTEEFIWRIPRYDRQR